ncbi:helix-hairpin-helix domain-containing protein [Patescibacteria group bacterium]|nr:helix-hairpin-helix domain-containing protein [Patescibacteria group bacterium]
MDYRKGETKVQISEEPDPGGLAHAEAVIEQEIKADLAGAVNKPGLYVLPAGSRLGELLALAGGFVSEASSLWVSKNLNLSQNVIDGAKVYIPFDWDLAQLNGAGEVKVLSLGVAEEAEQSALVARELERMAVAVGTQGSRVYEASSSDAADPTLINVNTATGSELDVLPGVGPAYASKIVEGRPYASYEDFQNKSGLSASLVESLRALISF